MFLKFGNRGEVKVQIKFKLILLKCIVWMEARLYLDLGGWLVNFTVQFSLFQSNSCRGLEEGFDQATGWPLEWNS